MKRKIMFFVMLIAIAMLMPFAVSADTPKGYLTQFVTSSVSVGQNISLEISPLSKSSSISCIGDGRCYYSEDIWKGIISNSINGTVKYDPNVFEFIDVSVSQKGGCCYESVTPKVKSKSGSVEVSWDSSSASDWGYEDTILVNFKVISVPSDNKSTVEVIAANGEKTSEVINIIETNVSNENNSTVDEGDTSLNESDSVVNQDDDVLDENDSAIDNDNTMDYIIVALLSGIMIFLIILICVMVSNNKKRN